MTNKNTFAVFGIFAVLLISLGMVSAVTGTLYIVNTTAPAEVYSTSNSYNITFNVIYNGNISSKPISLSASSLPGTNIVLSDPSFALNGTINESKAITATISNYSGYEGQNIVTSLIASATGALNANKISSTKIALQPSTTHNDTFCGTDAEVGNLTIYRFNIDNLGDGQDDNWKLLDEVDLKVQVRNTGSDKDIRDVMVEMKIEDSDGHDVTGDFNLDKESISLGRIRHGDRETATFHIPKVPADIETGTYKVYVKAYEDGNEDENCASTSDDLNTDDKYYEFDVESQYDEPAIIPRDGDIATTMTVRPGDNKDVSFNIYNLGDQDEEKVLVVLVDKNLGIRQIETFRNVDMGEQKQVSFSLNIPENATNGRHKLEVYTYFDYDDGDIDDIYSYDANSYDDLDEDFLINLNVVLAQDYVEPSIIASLESEIIEVGKELTVKIIITNNDEDNNFIISASNFEEWATLMSIVPQTISIKKGEFAEATLTLKPTVTGTHTFNIDTIVGGETYTQPVSITIPEEKSNIFGEVSDTMLYIIVGIATLLIIIALMLIIKLSKKRVVPKF